MFHRSIITSSQHPIIPKSARHVHTTRRISHAPMSHSRALRFRICKRAKRTHMRANNFPTDRTAGNSCHTPGGSDCRDITQCVRPDNAGVPALVPPHARQLRPPWWRRVERRPWAQHVAGVRCVGPVHVIRDIELVRVRCVHMSAGTSAPRLVGESHSDVVSRCANPATARELKAATPTYPLAQGVAPPDAGDPAPPHGLAPI